jgi:hypothetical protein
MPWQAAGLLRDRGAIVTGAGIGLGRVVFASSGARAYLVSPRCTTSFLST